MDARLGNAQRFLGRGDGRQRLVSHSDERGRLLGDQFLRSHHRRHRIADEAHLVEAQRVLVLRDGKDPEGDGEVLASEDGTHAVDGERPGNVDGRDARVRHG